MNTKTMRLPPRRVLMPSKRKERGDFHAPKPASATKSLKPTAHQFEAGSNEAAATSSETDSSNQLLAGYLAHEYLTKGTLFGQPFDPARSQGGGKICVPGRREGAELLEGAEPDKEGENYQRYVEVASLLKTDGALIEGIVNPTQLARFLHM